MYKVLLVDDEYMITEGLKKLIPFDHWNMEVVATAEDADQALDYVREHPVDVVITDVNMPGKTGLQMIAEMKDLIPDAAYIIMSGYQDFEYVKTALNLRVADYLLKPVNKVEMGNILEKIQHQIQQPSQELANRLIHDDISEEEFVGISQAGTHCGLESLRRKKALSARLTKFLGKIFNSLSRIKKKMP